jgi:homoserine kinase type II
MAVFTHISEEQLTRHLAQFDIGKLASFTGIAEGVENTNYKLITERGRFILTLFEKRTRAEDLPFFIAFMKHLHGRNIPCPGVIAARDGKEIVSLNDKPAIITSFLEGAGVRQIETFHVAQVGKLVAHMHLAVGSFTMRRESAMSLPAWKSLVSACAGKTDLLPLLQKELDYLEKNWPKNLPTGAVHADLFPDNVFFSGENLTGVIDFYFSCMDVFAYDLMLTLNAWCFEPAGLNRDKAALLLEAYQKERPLSEAEKNSLNFLGRAAALRIIATRLYDLLHPAAGAVITPKDPQEHVRILKFHQSENIFHETC